MKAHLIPSPIPAALAHYEEDLEMSALHVLAGENGSHAFKYANILILRSRRKGGRALALLACEATTKPALPEEPGTDQFMKRNFESVFLKPELLLEAIMTSTHTVDGVLEKLASLVRTKSLHSFLGKPRCILLPENVLDVAKVQCPPLIVWNLQCETTTSSLNSPKVIPFYRPSTNLPLRKSA